MQKWEAANGHNNSVGQILIAFIFFDNNEIIAKWQSARRRRANQNQS